MQTLSVSEDRAKPATNGLLDEARGLEALHRGWTQRVEAWRLAHAAAIQNATGLLARMDRLVAAIEAQTPAR